MRFETAIEGQLWKCPFCNVNTIVYKVNVPPSTQVDTWKQSKLLIKNHLELHKKDLLNQLSGKSELMKYEKVKNK